jgi:hypothetical protein
MSSTVFVVELNVSAVGDSIQYTVVRAGSTEESYRRRCNVKVLSHCLSLSLFGGKEPWRASRFQPAAELRAQTDPVDRRITSYEIP